MTKHRPRRRQPETDRSRLTYSVRVRDLVHGFVYLTELEEHVINHPLFQRLRHIRQNDVAHYVYPSLNVSRFEHSLGSAFVAGKMAINVTRSFKWDAYQQTLGLSRDEFEQACRLYALLHDVGHLPLSHLFEQAFEHYAEEILPPTTLHALCQQWFGGSGFSKLHEACGSALAIVILNEVQPQPSIKIKDAVLQLMASKKLDDADPLRPIKLLVDSEIDADRIDATARDGLLAGGEFGAYDIERLCSAVFVQPFDTPDERKGWRLAYSHKALGSIEALLLDRCRTHTWIHFHHRVVALKLLAIELITKLLQKRIITSESFPINNPKEMALRDDVWLLALLRGWKPDEPDSAWTAARDGFFYRNKSAVTLLWKNRPKYHEWHGDLEEAAQLRSRHDAEQDLKIARYSRKYQQELSTKLGKKALVFWIRFEPVAKGRVYLTDEKGDGIIDELVHASRLVSSLTDIWKEEPQYYVLLLGEPKEDPEGFRKRWVAATAEQIRVV